MEEKNIPSRKPNRLRNFKYDSIGVYFITICTKNKERLFWDNVGASIARPHEELTKIGATVKECIESIPKVYKAVSICNYVIMPNHIHLLLRVHDTDGRAMLAPTVSRVVQQLKGAVTKRIGECIWQKLFYDHIVRNSEEYNVIDTYINNNPQSWEKDELYN